MVTILFSQPYSSSAYFLMMTAIATLWASSRPRLWLFPLVGALLCGLVANRITPFGIAVTVNFGIICFAFYRKALRPQFKWTLGCSIFILSLLLGTHQLPGFHNWLLLSEVLFSPGALPTHVYLNLDKPLIGLFIIAFGLSPAKNLKDWKALGKVTLDTTLPAVIVLLGLSFALGYVKVDPKWFEFSWLWLLINLFFTCVAEEAFFRGFLQNQITHILTRWTYGPSISLAFTSILFGLAHFSGGWTYVLLATVAGLFYGYAFSKTQRIEASIGVHFLVNATHFLLFTYPALKR